jgi:hypothetical protein
MNNLPYTTTTEFPVNDGWSRDSGPMLARFNQWQQPQIFSMAYQLRKADRGCIGNIPLFVFGALLLAN